ncbi:IclR family transcriptional regulator [Bradyrhizobium zhanjiangense]|uniref:IclR family transcriptional regulator n=1 Tax=Bradyrhizobium zhanjiangense TaxID=1325107 RepID=A0ABY0DE75_9BRAD|nr:IclR family transcriptional regulator C-terminal domain-containing protein [Bradyrhizobium zhanjiangense]RXG90429.1 hypothetical protein EAS62_28405 [Bradyrhizobium zhanjiangense]
MKTVKTAVQILTMFSADTPAVTVSQAANNFGLTASAASRLLSSLATSGLIERQPDRSYQPGPLAYRLGLLYHAQNRLADRINDGARKVVAQTGHTCWVSVLTETNSMLISRFPGSRDQGFYVNAGNVLPANASAGGKALLARMSDVELRKLLTGKKLAAWTEKSKTDIDAVFADVAFTREHGWSIIVDELFVDRVSVGVAFSSSMESTPMALSISIPSASLEEIAVNIQTLTELACEVGQTIQDPYWSHRQPSTDQPAIIREVQAYMASS